MISGTDLAAPGHVIVTFVWAADHGECVQCGLPAAYDVLDTYGKGEHMRTCSVCAAQEAAEGGHALRYLFEDPPEQS
jgi:hypothetical protein